jgi:hypothetical protein
LFVHLGNLSGSSVLLRVFSFDNIGSLFDVIFEDLSALIWGFSLHKAGCWPSLISLSVVDTTVSLNSSVNTYVVLLVFGLVPVFFLSSGYVFIACGFPLLLISNNFFNFLSGSGFLFIGVLWVLFWWFLFAFFFLLNWSGWLGSSSWLGGLGWSSSSNWLSSSSFFHWLSLGKRCLTGEACELVFDWHWGVVNESAISLNFSGSSNSVLLIFALLVVFLLGGSDIGVTLVFESSLFGDGIEDSL